MCNESAAVAFSYNFGIPIFTRRPPMNLSWKKAGLATLLIGLAAGIVIGFCLTPGPGVAQEKAKPPAHRYTVVSSEGTNLIAVDNQSHTLFFYTVDHGSEPGADLKLRGTVDLTKLGESVLKPKLYKKKQKSE
jgi:hypothetical protein